MRLKEIQEATVLDRPLVHQQEEVPLHIPGGATVMILNDPVTPAEVVIEAVMSGTGLDGSEAARRVLAAHEGGWAPVASYASKDVAETVANKIIRHAASNVNYDRYRTMPGIPKSPRGPGGHIGPWPLQAEVMDAEQ